MRATMRELNWSGTVTYSAERVERPRTIDEAAELVARSPRVHGLGTRHSFNDVADGPGVLLDLTGIPTDLVVDTAADSATMGAGTRYGVVAPDLEAAGVALHNTGSLPHISLGGAIATGTHGSGTALGSLSTAVRAFEVLGPDGERRTVARGDDGFEGAVLHLGLLGIVTRVEVDVEPTYRMRQDTYGPIPWDRFVADVAEVHAAAYSVCSYTVFGDEVSEVLLKSRVPEGADDVAVPDALLGAPRLPGRPADGHHTARDGSVGPWWDRLPHFPIDAVPSVGSEVQSEHFVPLRHAAAALEAVRGLAERIQPHLHVCELRTMAADPSWLSPTQGEDVLCIAFTWRKHPVEVAALLPDLEARLAPFDGRPHWGKMSSLDADAVEALWPRLPDFRRLVAAADPDRTFASAFGERVLRT
ncbi:D-arabinono-1,4-lactone oxidase [Curtobacterium caseinilyticum]|uniref:D-arabinono-1,4-lactone oxidase n=1 Tax=Curtobacterium caseinilyticum TaxID=3055137 RepID=A0ABT7TMQ6_9MICO|nr:D-arabinono-1,4-lactone oxidase [Curtobacterium caseinilyticum]MDM7890873.1 D-arabinono-1,4-lactone oxidase [Curtobacterium caseinilyticum]